MTQMEVLGGKMGVKDGQKEAATISTLKFYKQSSTAGIYPVARPRPILNNCICLTPPNEHGLFCFTNASNISK